MIENQVPAFVTNFETFKADAMGRVDNLDEAPPQMQQARSSTPTEDEVTEITPIREKIIRESFASNIEMSRSHRRDTSMAARSA